MRDPRSRTVVGRAWVERIRPRVAFMSVIACAVVVACSGGGDDPNTLPDVTPTVTETATPEPTSADTPTDDSTPTADTTAALEAEITEFFKEYVGTINQSWTSREALSRRREMFADSCTECLAGFRIAERAHREDLVLEADEIVVRDVKLSSTGGNTIVFMTKEDSPAGVLKNADGKIVQRFDEYIGVQSVYQAVKTDSRWMITQSEDL